MSVDSSHVFWTSAHFEYSQNITGSLCFTFHYHMAQFEAGSLWLLLDDHVVFEDHNGHGNQWIKVQITLHGNNSKVIKKHFPVGHDRHETTKKKFKLCNQGGFEGKQDKLHTQGLP